ncbi:MAG: carbonic anhydrase [Desulfarculus sp.]|nr:carbonic anhydrase [Desulfarculus sp.]
MSFLPCLALAIVLSAPAWAAESSAAKPAPDQVLASLLAGNARFAAGQPQAAHRDLARVNLAASVNQGDYALATVLSCSDSRVPVELIFDVGVMDLFVIRVAGNVAQTDEIGSIEYGLSHVHTPLLMVLGHSGCGAVTAVINEVEGRHAKWERNIPPLVAPIVPAVKRAKADHPDQCCAALLPAAVEENVWQALLSIFKASPATRELVKSGKIMAVGALYDLTSGQVKVLDQTKPAQLLAQAEAAPDKAVEAFAAGQ